MPVNQNSRNLILSTLIAIVVFTLGFNIVTARMSKPVQPVLKNFQQALPGYQYVFPKDHASHEAYKTEWWYYTGHLKTTTGKTYGYELTFFRSNPGLLNTPQNTKWPLGNIYMAHFAVSNENYKTFFHTQIKNRGAYGLAGADTKVYSVWNENMFVRQVGNKVYLSATRPEYAINLILQAEKPLVIHGKNGVSQKADCPGCASHYYSYTRLKTSGSIHIGGVKESIRGVSWMDHEFGSNQLTSKQTGWDWFSVQLNNNTELMLYQLRLNNNGIDKNSSGTFVFPNGRSLHLTASDFNIRVMDYWKSPVSGGTYPMRWQVNIPKLKLQLTITPTFKTQELSNPVQSDTSYWEGSSLATGTYQGRPISAQAYVEMTGYAHPFSAGI